MSCGATLVALLAGASAQARGPVLARAKARALDITVSGEFRFQAAGCLENLLRDREASSELLSRLSWDRHGCRALGRAPCITVRVSGRLGPWVDL
jgi:hypothetical protein